MNHNTPLVSICCITFNHEKFIRDALEGFLMQKTNFPIEIIIHDDASTDKTPQIINEYAKKNPKLFIPILQKENQYSKGIKPLYNHILPKARGKYIAFCEGDDYWIAPDKLQKQVDFLEKNPNFGLIATDFNIFHQERKKMEYSLFTNSPKKFPIYTKFEDFLIAAGYMAPCTWVMRKDLIPKHMSKSVDGSFVLLLEFYSSSKVYVLRHTTAVYRKLSESSSHSRSLEKRYNRARGILKIQMDNIKRFKLPEELQHQVLAKHYKTVLPALIAMNKKDKIEEAQKYLKHNKELFLKLLFIFSTIPLSSKIFQILYRLKYYLRK